MVPPLLAVAACSSFTGSRLHRQLPGCSTRPVFPRSTTAAASPTNPASWKAVWTDLNAAKLVSLSPDEAAVRLGFVEATPPSFARLFSAVKRRPLLLDVRSAPEFAAGRATGAVNAALYRPIRNWALWDITRRAAFAFFGVFNGTELNPEFAEEVLAAVGAPNSAGPIIVCCGIGGSLVPTRNLKTGTISRSLLAAHELIAVLGYKDVSHLSNGFNGWFKAGYSVEGPETGVEADPVE